MCVCTICTSAGRCGKHAEAPRLFSRAVIVATRGRGPARDGSPGTAPDRDRHAGAAFARAVFSRPDGTDRESGRRQATPLAAVGTESRRGGARAALLTQTPTGKPPI